METVLVVPGLVKISTGRQFINSRVPFPNTLAHYAIVVAIAARQKLVYLDGS